MPQQTGKPENHRLKSAKRKGICDRSQGGYLLQNGNHGRFIWLWSKVLKNMSFFYSKIHKLNFYGGFVGVPMFFLRTIQCVSTFADLFVYIFGSTVLSVGWENKWHSTNECVYLQYVCVYIYTLYRNILKDSISIYKIEYRWDKNKVYTNMSKVYVYIRTCIYGDIWYKIRWL